MSDLIDWFDEDGMMHHVKNPEIDSSENAPLFTAEFWLLQKLLNREDPISFGSRMPVGTEHAITVFNPVPGVYKSDGMSLEDGHFSHDNMTGLYVLYQTRYDKVPKHLDTFKWNKRKWWHPRDIIFYNYAHIQHKSGFFYSPIKVIMLAILKQIMLISCRSEKLAGNGLPDTDGKILSFIRCKAFGLDNIFDACTKAIKKNKHFDNWFDVFKTYFREEGHPIPEMIKELENEIS